MITRRYLRGVLAELFHRDIHVDAFDRMFDRNPKRLYYVTGIEPVLGTPGFAAGPTVTYGQIFNLPYNSSNWLPGGGYIGSAAQDYLNTGATNTLRAGLLMGQCTSGTYNQYWMPSVIDALQAAITSQTATTFTLTPAGATGLVARIGSSGTLSLTGGPTTNATARTATVTYSAVNTTTGVVTITNPSQSAVQTLNFTNSPSGTFAISVIDYNGVKQVTAQITYSGTAATLVSNIQSALNTVLGTNQCVVSGTAVTAILLTFSGSNYTGAYTPPQVGITTDSLSAGNVSVTNTSSAVDGRFVNGSFVGATDGSQIPTSVIPDGTGVRCAGATSGVPIQWPNIVIGQMLISPNILPYYPADTGLRNFIKNSLNFGPSNYGFQFTDGWTAAT